MLFAILISLAVGLLVGGWLEAHFHRKEVKNPKTIIPEEPETLSQEERQRIELHLQEWKVVIETQMHFNDLIIRFRQITLTTFAALTGAAVAVTKTVQLSDTAMVLLVALPTVFWLSAAALDLLYYHRLLIGAVNQAAKFDTSTWLGAHGFFGLTATISTQVTRVGSRRLVLVYYLLPFVVALGVLLWGIGSR